MDRLYIKNATAMDDLKVFLIFSDDTTQVVNVGEFIRRHPHPQYNKYLIPPPPLFFRPDKIHLLFGTFSFVSVCPRV